jgi:mycothiol synthase
MNQTLDAIPFPVVASLPDVAFRHPSVPDDWTPLAELVTACRLADGVEEVPTAEYLAADWGNAAGLDPTRDFLIAERDGRMVGFVGTYPAIRDGALILDSWGGVHPDVRRRGLGTALHRWGRAHLAARASVDPREGPREFRTYALDIERADQALFAQEGYVPVRFGFEMRRPLTGTLPDHPLPEGTEIRPVRDADVRTILDGEDEAFRDHWGHREQTEEDIQALLAHPETNTALWQVAWDGDQVAGVVNNAIYRAENERLGLARGWLDRVSVRRPWRGRGLAKALCARSFAVLRDAGMDEAWLGVDGANPTGALQLYEGLGFVVVRRWMAYGRPIDGPAPAGWRSAHGELPADPSTPEADIPVESRA